MSEVLRNFNEDHPDFKSVFTDQTISDARFKASFDKYQNPEEADNVMRIQKNLDDVKDVMHRNIEEVLERGENLDQLMVKSEDLSTTSYKFYRTARNANSCC